MAASYTKLKSGEWGVRVTGSAKKGDVIAVTKKDGSTKTETVVDVVWSGNGITLCAIEQRTPVASPTNGNRRGGGPMTGRCWECGGSMPQWLADRGEECGNC